MTFGDVLDQVIDLVGQLGLQQHIAGQEFALGIDLLAAAHLDHFLGRHDHIGDEFLQVLDLGLARDLLRHLLLEIRVGVDDVPLGVGDGPVCVPASLIRSLRAPIRSISPY